MKPPRPLAACCGMLLTVVPVLRGAASIDESQLPPPASQKIDFRRDIGPILKETCLRCHGIERPKSGFRLTERALALKGGENGVDIIPGQSAKSPLIHYTARLVPDMEMPPEGKGTPLTSHQVSLLRAWIDQGVLWDDSTSAQGSVPSISVEPFVGGTTVHGDQGKFREVEAQREGWNGGVEQFRYAVLSPDGRSTRIEGHALRDDYELTIDWRSPQLGFARFGFDQFRTYYDDDGGFYGPFSPSLYSLGRDLHLDNTRAWAEFGLTLPNWPSITLGYEYRSKEGEKSMLSWGWVQSPSGDPADIRNIYPSSKDIDESTHIVRLDIAYDKAGFSLANKLRLEFYDSDTRRTDALNVPAGAPRPDLLTKVQEQHRTTQITDSVSVQKNLTDWWSAGLGYRYSSLDGDAALQLRPQDAAGQPAVGSVWSSDKIVLDEVWQVFNANSQFKPLPQLTATLGVQAQWKRQQTFGDVNLDEVVDPTDPTSGILHLPATERTTLDQTSVEENLLLRYTGLRYTSIYAEAKLEQEDYSRFEDQHLVRPPPTVTLDSLDSDATVLWQDYRVGFNSSPWQIVSFGGYYRHRDRETDYSYAAVQAGGAYPGFILSRDIAADEADVRTILRPLSWLKATLEYRYSVTDYHTTTLATSPSIAGTDATQGGPIYAGRYDAHTVNASASFTLWPRVYLSVAGSYQNSETTTADHGSPSVAPYRGELWSVLPTASFVVDEKTDLSLSYVFNRARFGQNNAAAGLPLGIDYDRHGIHLSLARRFSKTVLARLQYGYFTYDEPSSGSFHDYTAHQILLVAQLAW